MNNKAYKILEVIGAVFIVAAMLVIVGNVLSRALLGHPLQGSYEMTGLCAALFSSMAIPMATLAEGHIAVDLITSKLKIKPRIGLEYFEKICQTLVALALSYCAFTLAMTMLKVRETTDTLSIPVWPIRLIWAFCALLMVVFNIINITKVKAKYAKGGPKSAADQEMEEALETAAASMDIDVSKILDGDQRKEEDEK